MGNQGNSHVYTVLFGTSADWQPEFITAPGAESVTLHSALEEYEAALRLGSVDWRVALEAQIVSLTEAVREGSHDALPILDSLPTALVLTRMYGMKIILNRERIQFSSEELEKASLADLRALGLFALFMQDVRITVATWTRLPLTEFDPVVECLLGYAYLAMNEGELAYPRLLSAYRAYPESGTIALYLADAAIRCGDILPAEYYLGAAERLGDRDANFAYERVLMLILLAKGEEDAAIRLLCTKFCGRSAVAEVQFARYMERTHGVESALRAISGRINVRQADFFERATWEYFVALMEAWWFQSGEGHRKALVESVGKHPSMTMDEFHDLLRRYQLAIDHVKARSTNNVEPVPGMYDSDGWSRLNQPISAEAREQARSELVALMDRLQPIKLRNHCAQQCSPYPEAQAAERDLLNAP